MNDYEDKQRIRDAEYQAAWKNLSPRERRKLEKAGISGPAMPAYRTGKHDDEALIGRRACEPTDPGDAPDDAREDDGDNEASGSALRQVIGALLSFDDVQLSLDCFALVSGIGYTGDSMAEIGKRHGITRAAVSKRCVEMANLLGLLPSRAMRRLTARTSYERSARSQHHRLAH
jgi:hypothetical protein